MKKLLAMVLALVMTLSLAVSASAFKDDNDINDTYAEAVAVLNGMGVFKGYEDGSFQPKGDITRAEVAAIVYRVYTTDVKDAKTSLYASYNKFSDMAGASWAAGYIGYCANAELVKGYPDGTYKPSGKVTGYEVLAMILRAIGYDKNGEFTGADWALHVAQTAQQAGVLENVKGVDLNTAATRELVAELLFRTLVKANQVTYTAAFGYQTVSLGGDKLIKDNATLGAQNFELEKGTSNDNWGRLQTVWTYNCGDKKTTLSIDPDAAFQVATSECDICSALGEKKSAEIVEIYDNGELTKTTDSYKATATKEMVGAQGRQIEYYAVKGGYRMVIVDTYLALVTKNVDAKFDSQNHVKSQAKLSLTVYDATAKDNESKLVLEGTDGANFDYDVDDYVLVYVNKADEQNSEVVQVVTASEVKYTGASLKNDELKLDGEWVKFACKYAVDETALDEFGSILVIYDLFGNVIGTFPVEVSKTLTVIDSMFTETVKGESTFYSNLVGTDAEITKDAAIDTLTNAAKTKYDVEDIYEKASENEKAFAKKGVYDKLYNYTADEDGVLTLTSVTDSTIGTDANTNITAKDRYLYYSVGTKEGKIAFNDDTIFLVHENDGTYTSTTGDELEDLTASNVEFVEKNGYATVVYLYGNILRTTDVNMVYVPVQTVKKVETQKVNGVNLYVLKVEVVPTEGDSYTAYLPLSEEELATVNAILEQNSEYSYIKVGGFFLNAVFFKDTTVFSDAEFDEDYYSINKVTSASSKTIKLDNAGISAVAVAKIADIYVIENGEITKGGVEDVTKDSYVHVFWTNDSKLYVADALYVDKDLTEVVDDFEEYYGDYAKAVEDAQAAYDEDMVDLNNAKKALADAADAVAAAGSVEDAEQALRVANQAVTLAETELAKAQISGVATDITAAEETLAQANAAKDAAQDALDAAVKAADALAAAQAAVKLANDEAAKTEKALKAAQEAKEDYKWDHIVLNPVFAKYFAD